MSRPAAAAPPPFRLHPPRGDAGVARLVFHGRRGKPVLDPDVLAALGAALAGASRLRPRVLLVESAIPRIFAAGADLHLLRGLDAAGADRVAEAGQRTFARLAALPCLTIALVDGAAMGGGLDLALACDLRLATPHARFGHPGVKLGIVTSWGGTARLPRLVGLEAAKRLFYTGDPVGAHEADELGLVDAVGSVASLRRFVRRLAQHASAAPLRRRLRAAGADSTRRRVLLGLAPEA